MRFVKWVAAALALLGGGGTAVYYTMQKPVPPQGPPSWASSQARENGAKTIIICTVGTVTPEAYATPEGDEAIASEVTCSQARAIKGEVPADLTITVLGGTLNGHTMVAEHERVPKPGERIRFFLDDKSGRQRLIGVQGHPGMEVEP